MKIALKMTQTIFLGPHALPEPCIKRESLSPPLEPGKATQILSTIIECSGRAAVRLLKLGGKM